MTEKTVFPLPQTNNAKTKRELEKQAIISLLAKSIHSKLEIISDCERASGVAERERESKRISPFVKEKPRERDEEGAETVANRQ